MDMKEFSRVNRDRCESSEREVQQDEPETLANIVAHWRTQGGEAEFGPLPTDMLSADDVMASILRAVSATRARKARAQEPPSPQWQPMETAPKGPHVLVLYEQFGVTYWGCARWWTFSDGSGGWIGSSFYATGDDRNWTTFSSADNFRGWMPLPAPPVAEKGE